jgi:two-component system nitrate/nitrite response regulator NarL
MVVTSLLIADDHPIVLDGIESLLRPPEFKIVARCKSGKEVLAALRKVEADVLILDVAMPAPNGLEILRRMAEQDKRAKTLLLTASLEDGEALEAIGLSVGGIVLKETAPHQLIDAVREVGRGGRWIDPEVLERALAYNARRSGKQSAPALTPRERDIARLVAAGHRNKEIARKLSVTEGTVKMHVHNIYVKLGVESRIELAISARDNDLA